MIKLSENYGGIDRSIKIQVNNEQIQRMLLSHIKKHGGIKDYFNQDHQRLLFSFKRDHKQEEALNASTSYFLGHGWLIENELPIQIYSKLDQPDQSYSIDIIKMLNEALLDPQNLEHLSGLIEIRTNEARISVPQADDLLTPFILVTFVHLLRQIVKRGLRRDYYAITDNLESCIKGKILKVPTIARNYARGNHLHTYCRYDYFGIDHAENQLLKGALGAVKTYLQHYSLPLKKSIQAWITFITPAFQTVSERSAHELLKQHFHPHRLYKEYSEAIPLARLILKHLAPQPQQKSQKDYALPPYWIDMSKLYELYLFSKLRNKFKDQPRAIRYHHKTDYQEIDFLMDYQGNLPRQAVIDAKYKPYYKNNGLTKDDARQVSGYARLKSIYQILRKDSHQLIDAIIIYPDQSGSPDLPPLSEWYKHESNRYQNIYKVGIKLPVKSS